MAEQMNIEKAMLQVASALETMSNRLTQLEAQRSRVTYKNNIEIKGTENPKVVSFLKSIYGKKAKYKNLVSIEVVDRGISPTGIPLIFIQKVKSDGTKVVVHPVKDWDKKTI